MPDYREIVTKAVIAKGKKVFRTEHEFRPMETPSAVLGCWVINHTFSAYNYGDQVKINGTFDVNVWYSYADNSQTNVSIERVNYEEIIDVVYNKSEVLSDERDILARALNQPNCSEAVVVDGLVKFVIDKEFGVELVGETKMKVSVSDFYEAWPSDNANIDDDINNIQTDFL